MARHLTLVHNSHLELVDSPMKCKKVALPHGLPRLWDWRFGPSKGMRISLGYLAFVLHILGVSFFFFCKNLVGFLLDSPPGMSSIKRKWEKGGKPQKSKDNHLIPSKTTRSFRTLPPWGSMIGCHSLSPFPTWGKSRTLFLLSSDKDSLRADKVVFGI